MKSQLYIKWLLAIFIISVVTVVIIASLHTKVLEEVIRLVALSSADIVATQLSAFITISSAAPHYVEIKYEIPGQVLYEVRGSNRRLIVRPKYGITQMLNLEVDRLYAVDLTFEFKDVNSFLIVKGLDDSKSKYEIYAYRR